jgi:hypothetical protein
VSPTCLQRHEFCAQTLTRRLARAKYQRMEREIQLDKIILAQLHNGEPLASFRLDTAFFSTELICKDFG